MKADINKLLQDVKPVYWTDCYGNRDKHYKVHSKLNPELWTRIEEIWGRDWFQMRGIVIGNDFELGGCYATVPEKTWQSMVRQLKERLYIVRAVVNIYGGTQTYIQKEWYENKDDVILNVGLNRPEVVEYEILEAEHNKENRYKTAMQLYNEIKK